MTNSFTEMLEKCVPEMLKGMGTAIPGHVLAFNSTKQLAQVQIGVERLDTSGNSIVPPPIILVPVHFPGGKYAIEYEINKGDEGLIIFSQRCIEAWIDQGGVAPQKYRRFHDINDAMFIPGVRSQRGKLADFQNNGVRLRSEDGSRFVWLKNDGTAEITADTLTVNANMVVNGTHEINGAATQNGAQTITGEITHAGSMSGSTLITAGNVIGGGKSLATHTHQEVYHGTTTTAPL